MAYKFVNLSFIYLKTVVSYSNRKIMDMFKKSILLFSDLNKNITLIMRLFRLKSVNCRQSTISCENAKAFLFFLFNVLFVCLYQLKCYWLSLFEFLYAHPLY